MSGVLPGPQNPGAGRYPAIPVDGEYRLANSAAASHLSTVSMVRLEGKDCLDFLHRMSTNDVAGLRPGDTRKTILVNEKGRIIDLVQICVVPGSVLIVGSPGNAGVISRWFAKYIIMEEITVASADDHIPCVSVIGPEGRTALEHLAGVEQSAPSAFPLRTSMGGYDALVYHDDRCRLSCHKVVLMDGGQGHDRLPDGFPESISDETFETLRIEEGIPAPGRELTADVNALEAGLKKYISFSKGCYIGQEVIARIDTYNKLRQLLSLFLLPGADGKTPFSSGTVMDGGEVAGSVTSMCLSPRYGGVLGLGYRRRGTGKGAMEFIPEGSEDRHPVSRVDVVIPGYELYEITDEAV